MPLYEYECVQDGSRVELIRPVSQADAPVEDPEGRGRTFRRVLSVVSAHSAGSSSAGGGGHVHRGGCCSCGKAPGSCARP